ncbi:MAG TPA: hypothetical protein VMA71_00330 [Alloacidobacterium sp.]|nr:hypothetical protein [Alloacidobacterium sp.]
MTALRAKAKGPASRRAFSFPTASFLGCHPERSAKHAVEGSAFGIGGHNCRVPHPFAQFAKGWESKNLSWGRLTISRNRLIQNLHRTLFPRTIKPGTAPNPVVRRQNQPTFHWILMHVKQFFRHLLLSENVEVIKSPLPHLASNHIVYLSRRTLFHNLQHRGKSSDLRLAQEEMNMLGHDYISSHSKKIFLADFFEYLQKDIPRFSIQKRKSMVAAKSDEMKIVSAVVSREPSWHDGFCPSFHRDRIVERLPKRQWSPTLFAKSAKGWGTRQRAALVRTALSQSASAIG